MTIYKWYQFRAPLKIQLPNHAVAVSRSRSKAHLEIETISYRRCTFTNIPEKIIRFELRLEETTLPWVLLAEIFK